MQALLNRSTKNASTERVDKTMFRTFYGYVSSVADTKKHPDGSPASPAELRNVGAFLEGATPTACCACHACVCAAVCPCFSASAPVCVFHCLPRTRPLFAWRACL
jgi:hypothetical protein